MKTTIEKTRAAMEDAAAALTLAQNAFAAAEHVAIERRNACNLAVREAASAEGPDLVEALEARSLAQKAALSADEAVLAAGRAWKQAVADEAAARRAHRAARAPGARAEALVLANAIDGHLAAIEKILEDAAPLASEVQRDLCIYKGSGIWLNSPELGRAPVLGVFSMFGFADQFRNLAAVYRDGVAALDAVDKKAAA